MSEELLLERRAKRVRPMWTAVVDDGRLVTVAMGWINGV